MLTVSKCLSCGRSYTANVASCQICGGACVPVEANDANVVMPRADSESAPVPKAVCPCCDGERGSHFIEQTTRRLIDVSLVPRKRTYRVTTVKVPGVCTACHRSIEKKRFMADVLTPLPLLVAFVVLVIADQPVFALPVLLYLIYLASSLTYSWADFLLYGSALSWKLVDYIPREDKESSPRYYSGWMHGALRFAVLPALVAAIFVILGTVGTVKRFWAPPVAATLVASTPVDEKPVAPPRAAPTNYAPSTIAPAKTPVEEALRIFRMTALFAVPVDAATLANPALGQPATTLTLIKRKRSKVVRIYYDEAKVPPGTAYELMNGPTALANFQAVKCDGLAVGDGQIILKPTEVSELATKVSGTVAPPSAIKIATGH